MPVRDGFVVGQTWTASRPEHRNDLPSLRWAVSRMSRRPQSSAGRP